MSFKPGPQGQMLQMLLKTKLKQSDPLLLDLVAYLAESQIQVGKLEREEDGGQKIFVLNGTMNGEQFSIMISGKAARTCIERISS